MKTNVIRILLDSVMVILLVLMYEVGAVGLYFHEVGGLAVCGLFVIHKAINRKWIAGVSRRLFTKKLPARTRIGYVVDVLLLISMAFIAVSGVMISRTVLVDVHGGVAFWRPAHYFAAAAALALVGIHIGLHWSFIRSMVSRVVRVPQVVAKPLGVVCLVAVLVFGAYSLSMSSLTDWLSGPFAGDAVSPAGKGLGRHGAGSGGGEASSSTGVVEVIATYGSIIVVCASAAALTEKTLKQKRPAPAWQPA